MVKYSTAARNRSKEDQKKIDRFLNSPAVWNIYKEGDGTSGYWVFLNNKDQVIKRSKNKELLYKFAENNLNLIDMQMDLFGAAPKKKTARKKATTMPKPAAKKRVVKKKAAPKKKVTKKRKPSTRVLGKQVTAYKRKLKTAKKKLTKARSATKYRKVTKK